NIRVILFSIHSDDGNPSSVNIKQHCVMRTGNGYSLKDMYKAKKDKTEHRFEKSTRF
ncbi:hypothetical protein Tco_1478169, partial [Tanacetum coccineum]